MGPKGNVYVFIYPFPDPLCHADHGPQQLKFRVYSGSSELSRPNYWDSGIQHHLFKLLYQ